MRLVTAVISAENLDAVKKAVQEKGIHGITISQVLGSGRQKGRTEVYRGSSFDVAFVPKVKLEIVVEADRSEEVVASIVGAARTGEVGDGKVWVTPVEQVVRVRTGELGVAAL